MPLPQAWQRSVGVISMLASWRRILCFLCKRKGDKLVHFRFIVLPRSRCVYQCWVEFCDHLPISFQSNVYLTFLISFLLFSAEEPTLANIDCGGYLSLRGPRLSSLNNWFDGAPNTSGDKQNLIKSHSLSLFSKFSERIKPWVRVTRDKRLNQTLQ